MGIVDKYSLTVLYADFQRLFWSSGTFHGLEAPCEGFLCIIWAFEAEWVLVAPYFGFQTTALNDKKGDGGLEISKK